MTRHTRLTMAVIAAILFQVVALVGLVAGAVAITKHRATLLDERRDLLIERHALIRVVEAGK